MTERSRLNKLPEDILLRILVLTEISTVLTLSQVNSHLHAITSVKQLWVLLTSDLLTRGLIDIPLEDVSVMSSEDFKAEVKRAVCGPRTWSPDSEDITAPLRRYTVPLEDDRAFSAVLLPGGKYLVLHKHTDRSDTHLLECWDVRARRCVWAWSRIGATFSETRFTICRGTKIVASLALIEESSSQLLLLELDLDTGHYREISRISPFHPFSRAFQLVDDYFGCVCSTDMTFPPKIKLLLINHQTQQYLTFDYSITATDICIVPGYVFLTSTRFEPGSVRAYSMVSLEPFWQPLAEFDPNNMPSASALAPSSVFLVGEHIVRADYSQSQPLELSFAMDQSLLRRESYLLQFTERDANQHVRMVFMLRLDFSSVQGPRCVLLSSVTSDDHVDPAEQAIEIDQWHCRGGYSLSPERLSKEWITVMRRKDCEPKQFKLEDDIHRARFVGLSPNGGLVVLHSASADIFYYE
ncbi:hypothetical protein R3P38DRAFT_2837110 [Favolaschia claudopus]|uniref:F-box domain-containing protein n=1 Tax=Favolaschia claudopus TaxID=2862362 RepID=A0AAW0E6T7_9AGAR